MKHAAVEHRLECRCVSSLVKIFADEELREQPYRKASALANETFSFQIAFRSNKLLKGLRAEVDSELQHFISLRSVGLVPAEMPIYFDHDENVLRTTPGLYPDPLYPIKSSEGLTALPNQWRSVWLTVQINGHVEYNIYPIRVFFISDEGQILAEEVFQLEVVPANLPDQQLIHTEWFYADCLSVYYDVEVFSEYHWELIENYVESFVRHGINMILTPLFTLPLDTMVGGERPTLQLVDIGKVGKLYRFGFERLKRWTDLCLKYGIKYFEFSHLFTQWGAKHAPKIIAMENKEPVHIFGWETDATGNDYKNFLDQFLPELLHWIRDNNLENRSYFHVSDEPHAEHLSWYESASLFMRRYLGDFPIIDALSNIEYYEKGLVKNPIPASNRIEPFLEKEVPNLWTYYCSDQYKTVSNRFFCFPSARNRIIGMQLYKHNIAGFLHWGYNFWFAQFSRFPINPFQNTDSNYGLPAGDGFLVYPGSDGKPIDSIRLEVLYDALQDLRALCMLEGLIGRSATIAILEEGLDKPLTFKDYPLDSEWLLNCRERINHAIHEHSR